MIEPALAECAGVEETQLANKDSMPPPRRLAVNFLFLSGGEMTAKLLTFASFSYLARILGPWNYGILEFALALMVLFNAVVDLGLGSYGAREIARNPEDASRLLHEITGVRLVLAVFSMASMILFALAIHKSIELKLLLTLYGVSLLAGPFLLQWFFQGFDQMHWVGIASVVRQTGFATLVFLFCRRGSSLVYIGVIECASVAAVAAFCLYVVRRPMKFPWPWPHLHPSRLAAHLREAFPIGLSELAWAFMWYFCTVLLGFIFMNRSLGWYSASHRALMALHTFVWLYFFNLLPSISRCVKLPNEHLLRFMDASVRFTAWTGLFGAAALTIAAPALLKIIYGPAFVDASGSFSILAWMLPIAMLSGHHRYILIAYNQQKRLLYCTVASGAVAVLLSFLLVSAYGGEGAAWTLLFANAVNFVLVYVSVKQLVVEVPVHRQLVAPLAGLAVALACYLIFARYSVWIAVVVACLAYAAGLIRFDRAWLSLFLVAVIRKTRAAVDLSALR